MIQDFIIWTLVFFVMIGIVILVPSPPEEITNFDRLYLDDINEMLTPREREVLIDYINTYAWHYGRLYHLGDAKKIQEAVKEKFELPEEVFKSI